MIISKQHDHSVYIETLKEQASEFVVQLDSLANKVCHCSEHPVPIINGGEGTADLLFVLEYAKLCPVTPVSSEGSNHLDLEPLEYHTPPVGTILPLQLVPDQEMSNVDLNNVGSSSRPWCLHYPCIIQSGE